MVGVAAAIGAVAGVAVAPRLPRDHPLAVRTLALVAVLLGSLALLGLAGILVLAGRADVGAGEAWQARGMAIGAVVIAVAGLAMPDLTARPASRGRTVAMGIVAGLALAWIGLVLSLDGRAYVLGGGGSNAPRAVLVAPAVLLLAGLAGLLRAGPPAGAGRGACDECGYDRRGLAAARRCPECGAAAPATPATPAAPATPLPPTGRPPSSSSSTSAPP